MNKPSEAELIGYLLGALDAHEQRMVEASISRDDSVRLELERLEARMAAISFPNEPDERPPLGLARRTCNLVAALDSSEPKRVKTRAATRNHSHDQSATAPNGPVALASANEYAGRKTGWSLVDVLVTTAVCALIAMIFLPALANSRFQADIQSCQNNLRQIGMGLQNYADNYSGRLIPIPESRELGVAGVYAPRLNDLHLVKNEQVFFCSSQPGNDATDSDDSRRIPTWQELINAKGDEVYRLRQQAGGDYAYTLGHFSNGVYCQPEISKCSATTVILGDTPDSGQPGFRSLNHGGRGQNVLLGDFSTKYLMSCMASPGDNFYQNDHGMIAAGTSPADSVLGSSSASPFIDLSQRW